MEKAGAERLFSRAGAIGLFAFVVLHLLSNASALKGEASYSRLAGAIHASSLLPLLEILIVVPLVYHAFVGLKLLRRSGDDDAAIARHGARTRWRIQRATAIVLLVFLVGHLWELRLARLFGGLPAGAYYTVLTSHLSWTWHGVPWLALFYLVGLGAAAFHVAGGLRAAARWGRTDAPGRGLTLATAAAGCVVFLIGGATVLALATGAIFRPDPLTPDVAIPCGSAAAPPPAPSASSH